MDDYISRQAAIELCDWYQHEFCECDYAFGELANELHKLPSAQRWIPCSEILPEPNVDVLVCNDDGKQSVAVLQMRDFYEDTMPEWQIKYCVYDSDVWDEFENGMITAWMPLPEPYKENT